MAENTPGNDPLDDRLRKTFNAERDDIERRHAASRPAPRSNFNGLTRWAPLAVAATVLALAGFFFLGNARDADQAVELDVAAQPGEGGSEQAPTEGESDQDEPGQGEAVEAADPGERQPNEILEHTVAAGDTISALAARYGVTVQQIVGANGLTDGENNLQIGQVLLIPPPESLADAAGPIPFQPGVDMCAGSFDPELTIAWANGMNVPVATEPTVEQDPPLAGLVESGTTVTLTGGCTRASSADDAATWYEVAGDPAGWVRTEFLSTETELQRSQDVFDVEPTDPESRLASPNECGVEIEPGSLHFVWGIGLDDPDGGLVAHTQAGIGEPVTRVLPLDEVATATGGCQVLPSGSNWLELRAPDGTTDWVSGRFLQPAKAACLVGEQYGTQVQDAGPEADSRQIIGPVEGVAVFDVTHVAFAVDGASTYRWFPVDAVRITPSCYGEGPTGAVCLVGSIQLIDPQSAEPVFADSGSIEAERTGRVIPAFGPRAIHDLVEATVTLDDGSSRTGLVDPVRTGFAEAPCSDDPAQLDTFEARPCAVNDSTPLESSGAIGVTESDADHVHNIRIEQRADCIRAVIELGTGVWTDTDGPAQLLPVIESTKTATAATVRFLRCEDAGADCPAFSSGDREPQRVDFDGGSVFIGIDPDFQTYVTMLHDFGRSSVTFINSPARIVIDWRPDNVNASSDPVIGQYAIFPDGLDSLQPGRPVRGLARPFEASGEWYIFPATGDPSMPLDDPATAVVSGFYNTSGWTTGWGEFVVELPPLLPDGAYVIAFGEAPANGDGSFLGSGALVTVAAGEATPIRAVDPIRLTEPITTN